MEAEETEGTPWVDLAASAERGDASEVADLLEEMSPADTARAFANLREEPRHKVLALLRPEAACRVIEALPEVQAADLIEGLEPDRAASIASELRSDEQADLLSLIPEEHAEAILGCMEPEAARIARRLAAYPPDLAGGLMVAEYLRYPAHARVGDVLDDLRANTERYRDYDVQYGYVTARDGRLVGVLAMRDLLLADNHVPLRNLMIEKPLRVSADLPLDELRDVFEEHAFVGVPVVAERDVLVGVVRRADVQEALEDRSESDHLKSQGIVGGEELRSMPVWSRSGRRLSWLSVNVVLNLVAASVIALHQETLQAAIALAVFLPIVSDMSGCSGNQAVAVSMRELTLGVIRPVDALRVWFKEMSVGVINGAALGVLIAVAAWLWKGDALLGAVVGAALALNTLVAVSLGGVVPLALKRMRIDPALASGPVLTTVTDMCGFALLLGFAAAYLPATGA
ncbi:MAG: magnesium transporter [Myxococcota bacterium]